MKHEEVSTFCALSSHNYSLYLILKFIFSTSMTYTCQKCPFQEERDRERMRAYRGGALSMRYDRL